MAVQTSKKSSALPWPALVPLGHHAGKAAISLQKTVILVGSRHNAHLHLLSRHVSKAHALILNNGGSIYIRDLASREQIYVNGVAEREAWLEEGDLLKIGSFTFKYKVGPTAGAGPAGDAPPHDAVLAIEGGDAPLAVADKVVLIGRRATCDISLIEASVSTAHAVLFHVGGKRYIRDLGSRTGTWVNGAKIHQVEVAPGDSIKIGETEMRYGLVSEYERAIAPAGHATEDLDELEHLVGTAPLDMAAEMERAEPVSPDLEADLRSMFGAGADSKPAKDEDLIELEIAHEPTPAPAAKAPPVPSAKQPPAPPANPPAVWKEAPRPQPKAAPVEEPIELEPEAEAPREVTPVAHEQTPPEADWVEIDLSTDPDVSDIPSAADTRAIGTEFYREPAKPTISPRVVDEPLDVESEASTEVEAPGQTSEQVLLGQDLHEPPVSPVDVVADEALEAVADEPDVDRWPVEQLAVLPPTIEEPAEAKAPPSETALDATWPEDLVPAEGIDAGTATEEADPLGSRGWQKMSRAEQDASAEIEAPPEIEEAKAAVAEPLAVDQASQQTSVVQTPIGDTLTIEEALEEEAPPVETRADEFAVVADETVVIEPPLEESATFEAPAAETPAEDFAAVVVDEAPEIETPADEPTAVEMPVIDSPVVEAPVAEAPAIAVPADEQATPLVQEAAQPAMVEKPAGKKGRGRKTKVETVAETPIEAIPAIAPSVEEKPKKRGRKSKKEKEAELRAAEASAVTPAAAAGVAAVVVADDATAGEEPKAEVSPPAETTESDLPANEQIAPVEEQSAPVVEETSPIEMPAEPVELQIEQVEELAAPIEDPSAAIEESAVEAPIEELAAIDVAPINIESLEPIETQEPRLTNEPEQSPEPHDVPLSGAPIQPEPAELGVFDEAFEGKWGDAGAESASAMPALEEVIAETSEDIEQLEDIPQIEEFQETPPVDLESPSQVEAHHAAADPLEDLDEVLVFDEEVAATPAFNSPQAASPEVAPSAIDLTPVQTTPTEDDFFADMEDIMPVLELDAAELGPSGSSRDPDVLLALDQVDPDALEDIEVIEVIETTEPTLDSALDMEAVADQEVASPQPGETSLTDSAFGRQMEEFATTSSGEIVEELPEIEEILDADEELAIALGSEDPAGDDQAPPAPPVHEDRHNITAGGAEPSALGAVSDESLSWEQFEAGGESVELEMPGVAEADAVLGGQVFVGDASGQDIATPTEEMAGQSFVSEGETLAAPPGNVPAVEHRTPPTPPFPPTQAPQAYQGGGAGGFVLGADLSSFIGGMPLYLPDVAPTAAGFGRTQVSLAGAKAPWQQAQRPSFPMGQSLAQEMMDAAKGLRDAEDMDDETEESQQEEDAITDDGAPGDEWNVAGILDDEQEAPLEGWATQTPTAEEPDSQDRVVEQPIAQDLIAEEPAEESLLDTPLDQTLDDARDETDAEWPELASIEEIAPEMEAIEPNDHPVEMEAVDTHDNPVETEVTEAESIGIDAEISELPADNSSQTIDEAELLLELGGEIPSSPLPESQSFTPAPDESALPEPAREELTIEELTFDEPPLESLPAPRRGAIEEAVAELEVEQSPEVDSVVDRTPPPPVLPVKAPRKMVIPPPPARTLRARKSAQPAEPQPSAEEADPIFGSMEHGTVGAPFAGMGGVREVDVFSQASEDLEGAARTGDPAVFGGQMLAQPANGDEPSNGNSHLATTGRRPQRAIVPPRMGVLGAGVAVADAEMGEPLTRPAYRVVPKRATGRRVLWVVILMIVCMAAAVAGILYFVHPKLTSTGELHYQNVGALTRFQRENLRTEQFEKLASPQVRLEASTHVAVASIDPGFLKDSATFAKEVRTNWPDERPDTLSVAYTGADANDKQRVYALLLAMHTENHTKLDLGRKLKADIEKLHRDLKELEAQKTKSDALNKRIAATVSDADMQKLESTVREADSAYDKAMAGVKDAQFELRRAQEQLPSPGQKSLTAGAPSAAGDAQLAALQKSLADAAAKIDAAKGAASEEADGKRKMLDQAIELFQQTAAGLMKENPELGQYVRAVQRLQEKTHKMGGDLIEVQQQLHTRLSSLKKDMDEQVQAHRTEIWTTEKGLIDLRAQLDLAQRLYNAGIAEGLPAESKEIKTALADIKNLNDKIEARKMAVGNDPLVTRYGEGLQEIIKITKERLETDRQRIEKDIKDQEEAFAQSNIVEKLPDTQRSQAAALKAKQEAINDLRKQYAAALDRRTAESNASLRELEGQVTDLTGKIDERKRHLASESAKNLTQQQEAERRATLEQKQLGLKKAEELAAGAQKLYLDSTKTFNSAVAARTESASARMELEAINQGLSGLKEEGKQKELNLAAAQEQLAKLVTVEQPREDRDVRVVAERDDRWRFIAFAVAGLAVVFVGALAVVSVSGGQRRSGYDNLTDEDHPEAETGPLAIQEIGPRRPGRNTKSAAGF